MSEKQRLIALVDANCFFVSAHLVFRPDLWNKPVGVLSSNDGCVIARNQTLKSLGIKMGAPLFEISGLVKRHNVHLFSSTFPLYADMSARVMATLEEFTPCLDVYSIDEAFLDLTGVCEGDPIAYGKQIKRTVFRNTGIPTCVGMGPTKTLAKLANFAAKKWPRTDGVVDLSDPVRREKLMKIVSVNEVWGIGSRTTARLELLGIKTAWDLASQPVEYVQAQFNVVIARTVQELNGIACLELEEVAPDKQQIVCSRSFGQRLTEYSELSEALSEFCTRAAEKLRRQQSVTSCITVFIRTNPFSQQEPQYQRSATLRLSAATQDTRTIIGTAKRLLKEIFRVGYGYQKCGVQLSQIEPHNMAGQGDLFDFTDDQVRKENRLLMETLDRINHRYPKSISVAATGVNKAWKPKAEWVSPAYTTNWEELLTVQC